MSSGYVCPECGLAYDSISPADAAVAIRSFTRRYRSALAGAHDQADAGLIRRKLDASTWSALEYTAHVADLYELFSDIVTRMFREDSPSLSFWDPDQRAVEERYNDLDPATVLDRLDTTSASLAGAIDRVDAGSWGRTATFPFGERDLLTMVRNAVHEGSHHLRDVERVLDASRGRADG